MNLFLIVLLSLFCFPGMGRAEETFPVIRLSPDDFVQDSIKQVHWTTNTFAVKWTYTEAGAKKMLAFWELHPGQKVCIQVGDFKTPPFLAPEATSPITHSDWKADWLKRRTDKFLGVSESDARKIVTGMKGG